MKKWVLATITIATVTLGPASLTFAKNEPDADAIRRAQTNLLFWTVADRDAAFRGLDEPPFSAKSRVIKKGKAVFPLPQGKPIAIATDIDGFMKDQRAAGLVIVQNGRIRLERYGLDFNAKGRWTSFSVAKSFTSTLVGAAIKDGYIKSVDEKVSAYIPDLKGSAYDDVTIEQLLTMTSGVKWNEDYNDKNSDVALFNTHQPEPGVDVTVSYMRKLPREAPPGTKWVYKTGETNLIGVLVSSATKKNLSDYLSEKIWAPFGMEQNASWLLGPTGSEISGCCIQASTRDFARMGVFMLRGGVANGKAILPKGWITKATTRRVGIVPPGQTKEVVGRAYGYQWWTNDDGSYGAQGIFGQGIFIDPKRKLVIATNSNWPTAIDGKVMGPQRTAFYKAVQAAVDIEARAKR